MAELNQLSKIGFGCYRISCTAAHYAALRHAITLGCNLIDTAATYMQGQSEIAIGRVISDFNTTDQFIITKAGYVGRDELAAFGRGEISEGAASELVRIDDNNAHCLHPDFLRYQLSASLSRLRRNRIDGFLLHNPEISFASLAGPEDKAHYVGLLRDAFCFLEDQVASGLIRYYGISSNILLSDPCSFEEIMCAVRAISKTHHFRLLQFPMNLAEMRAIRTANSNLQIVNLAQQNGLRIFTNRPLNARLNGHLFRLATYDHLLQNFSLEEASVAMLNLYEAFRARLLEAGISQAGPIKLISDFLSNDWKAARDIEAIACFFDAYLAPIFRSLYSDSPEEKIADLLRNCREFARLSALRNLTEDAQSFRLQLIADGCLDANDNRPLPVITCESYIKSGANHVLIGMRSTQYVDQMKPFF